jgi:hypothetical protein
MKAKKSMVMIGIFTALAILGLVFTGCGGGTTPTDSTWPPNAVTLTFNSWADGSLAANGEQWFKFTATAATQYIHFEPGTLGDVDIQLYDSTGTTVGSQASLYGSTLSTFQLVTINNVYYIRVTPYNGSGTYRIAFSALTTQPPITLPTTGVTQLTANTWASGYIATSDGKQWFKFTATAATQYIHFEPGNLGNVDIQLYDSTGTTVENHAGLFGSGEVYYIKVTPNSGSGTYRIAFSALTTQPPITLPTTGVTQLTANTWADGNVPTDGEQWFKFTATADTQYIHFGWGAAWAVYAQLYDSNGMRVGRQEYLGDFWNAEHYSVSQKLVSSNVYYIKVMAETMWYAGAYRIAFNATETPPPSSFPSTGVTQLAFNTWADGSRAENDEQWFKFTATTATQYIHFEPGTLDWVYIQLYDSTRTRVGSLQQLGNRPGLSIQLYVSMPVTSSDVYHIKVMRQGGGDTYRIAFNTTETSPPINLPTADITPLTANTWASGNIAANGEQWFKFTATAATQYIHFDPGTLSSVNVQLYDSTGTTVGNQESLNLVETEKAVLPY